METNEVLKTAPVHEAEAESVKLLKQVEELKEGDLKGVEHEVLTRMFALGRSMLERLIQDQVQTREIPTRRQGSCGHEQRLVDKRGKQILTVPRSRWKKRRRPSAVSILSRCQHDRPSSSCSQSARRWQQSKSSRWRRCGSRQQAHRGHPRVSLSTPSSKSSGSTSSLMGSWHDCGEAVCRWKSTNSNGRETCTAR